MKKYKLKRWYPSLDKSWVEGDIIRPTKNGYYYNEGKNSIIHSDEVENNPDFWELIEGEKPKPLFITDDGVEVFNEETTVYCITRGHNKHEENYRIMRKIESYLKIFFHESNADEYIWRNKPVFSYEDFIKWGNIPYPRAIEQLAKGRSER